MTIVGSKGGGGGSFKQTPDNLRSVDTFEGLLGIGLGPFKGPTRGLKSITIDGTAVENETGELNFDDFIVNFADGDPLKHPQVANLRLGGGASPIPVQLTLSNTNGSNPVWVTKTVTNQGAAYIDLRFIVSQLYEQTKKGIFNETATIEIEMKPTGSTTWINPTLNNSGAATPYPTYGKINLPLGISALYLPRSYWNSGGTDYKSYGGNYKIYGKTTSPSVYELRIAVPNDGDYENVTWDVRCRLLERDSYNNGDSEDNVQEKRTISWESVAAVYPPEMGGSPGWEGVAWLQLYGKASDQLSGVPTVEGIYDTKIVAVPPSTLFDPETRIYQAGIWDGSWENAFTNDPAWCLADLISDSIGGISSMAPGSYLNKWDALEASKWFSEQVSDGDGGTHPRFSMNVALTDKQKSTELMRYMAGAVGGMIWDNGNGEWRLKIDKPETPVDLFTLENIVGEFNYSHTDVDTRYNDIVGKFVNEEMDYREDSVHLYDDTSKSAISLIGRKPTTIALVGCTNRQEAMRRVMMRLRSACRETRNVTFVTNRRGKNIDPLSTILIADQTLGDSNQRTTGRVVSVAPDRLSVTLRDDIRLEDSVAYTLRFSLTNPDYDPSPTAEPTSDDWRKPLTVLTRNVTNTNGAQRGNVKTIYLDEALPANAAEYLTVALEATGLATIPVPYRVLTVEPQEDGESIAISAIEVDTGKWDAVDNVSKDDTVYVEMRGRAAAPVLADATLLTLTASPASQGSNVLLSASWLPPDDVRYAAARVRHRVNDGNWTLDLDSTQLNDFAIVNPVPGIYEFEISSLSRDGQLGYSITETLEVTQQLIDATILTYADGTPLEDLKPSEPGATSNEGALADLDDITLSYVTDAGLLASKSWLELDSAFITNKSLANLDATANTKLSGIEAGATYNAGALADLDNIDLSYVTDAGSLASKNNVNLDSDVLDGTTYKRFANTEKTKLSGIEAGATYNVGALADLDNINLSYVTDAGSLASKNNVDLDIDVLDGTTYKRFASTEKTKLSGIEAGATYNVGALADLDDIDLSYVTDAGLLASKNSVDLASSDVTNKSLANLDLVAAQQLSEKNSVFYSSFGYTPALDLQFAYGQPIDDRITFARASTAVYFGPDGLWHTAAANEPRVGYLMQLDSNGDRLFGGLHSEPPRTNYFARSSDPTAGSPWAGSPTNGTWAKNQTDLFGNANSATRVTATNGASGVFQLGTANFVMTGAGNICGSIIFAPRTAATVWRFSTGNMNGAVTEFSVDGVGGSSILSSGATNSGIDYLGNGVYRVWQSFPEGVDAVGLWSLTAMEAAGDPSWTTLSNSQYFDFYHFQVENGLTPTSPILTTGATATRAEETAKIDGTDFSDFYNEAASTFFFEAVPDYRDDGSTFNFYSAYSSNLNETYGRIDTSGSRTGQLNTRVRNSTAVNVTGPSLHDISPEVPFKMAHAYSVDGIYLQLDELALQSTEPAGISMPTPSELRIGYEINTANCFNGFIRAVQYYDEVLPAAKLAELTSANGTAPTANLDGDLWVDRDQSPVQVKQWDETLQEWQLVANYVAGTLDLLDDAGLGSTADWNQIIGASKPEDNADITRVLTVSPTSIDLRADHLGNVYSEQLPLTIQPTFTKGGVQDNPNQTWTFTKSSTLTATQDTTSNTDQEGKITVTAVTGAGSVTITSDGRSVSIPVRVTKDPAPPEQGGGGAPVTSSSISTYPQVTSGSFPTDPPTIKTITANGSGQVDFAFSWTYEGNGSTALSGKIVYRVAGSGGAWTDAQAATTGYEGSAGYFDPVLKEWMDGEPGFLGASFTKTGLTADEDYEWGMMIRRSTGSTNLTPSGNATAEQP